MKINGIFFNSKILVIRAVLIALIISVMAVIFGLSAQTGEASGSVSGGITESVLAFFGIHREDMSEADFINIESAVRTMAHFSEYALLGLLCAALAYTYKIKNISVIISSASFSSLYAITDELHQIFVPGRGAQVIDVIVDVTGAICGASIFVLVSVLISKIKKRA